MAGRLRSTLRKIPWSLLTKAALFGAGWLFLPRPLFIVLALYLYFSPFFESFRLGIPFLATLGLSFFLPPHGVSAALIGIIFFLMGGIKDFVFINRSAAYEILIFLLLFAAFVNFFGRIDNWQNPLTFIGGGAMSFLFFLLARGFLDYHRASPLSRRGVLSLGMGAFLLWQFTIVLLFMPLSFLNQAALLFLGAVFLIEFFLDHEREPVNPRRILFRAISFVVLAVIIFAINPWGL